MAEAFSLSAVKDDCDLSELDLLLRLSRRGIELPPVGLGQATWEWNAQTLFLLALLEQPGRWLQLIDAQCLQRLAFNPAHPLARLQPLLQRLRREQGSCDGLLGWLQGDDPVHGVLVQQLFSVQQALDSARLPANTLLYTCVESDREACGDDLLGLLMFWGVLYHDPSTNAEQHRALLQSIAAVSCEDDWFEGFRDGLIKGQPVWPPRKVLTDFGVDKLLAYEALDALKSLIRYGAAGVPKTRVLRQLQQGKDDVQNSIGLRLALCALLSWSSVCAGQQQYSAGTGERDLAPGVAVGAQGFYCSGPGVCGDCAGGGSDQWYHGLWHSDPVTRCPAVARRHSPPVARYGPGHSHLIDIHGAVTRSCHFCHWCCSVFREINYPTATACRRTAVVATCCPAACRPHCAGSTAKGAVDPAPC
jgi:DNA-binding FrmR family transcriptional regulator